MNINPLLIEKLAAEAFWYFTYKYGIKNTGFPTSVHSIPSLMWSKEIAKKKLMQLGITEEKTVELIYYLVAENIAVHGQEERNIIGLVYVEDFEECKEKDFPYTNFIEQLAFDSDEKCDYNINIKGTFSYNGTLLLRTPFPAGILLKEDPIKSNLKLLIQNTTTALGFEKTIIMLPGNITILPDNPYGYKVFASGIFHIPTKGPISTIWKKIIPNSTCILEQIDFNDSNGNENSIIINNKKSGVFFR
ncbi:MULTISPECIES: hypothetical protein [unclassified Rickettsia]|uniref:hypothetical protein n=1 Tax=unclassified Rickettsia TaxID=114295 RepID=UPI003132A384